MVAKASEQPRFEVAALKESMFFVGPETDACLGLPPYSMSTFAIQDHMSKVVL